MKTIELARKAAALNKKEASQKAYLLFLQQNDLNTEEEYIQERATCIFEASYYLLLTGYDVRIPYRYFAELYNAGFFKKDIYAIMEAGNYQKAEKVLKKRYEKNCRILTDYPYIFKKAFPRFDELEIRYFPYGENGFLPFEKNKNEFGSYIDFHRPVIERHFFSDPDKPVFVEDLFSSYQMEYLMDNVRDSRDCGKENHIYLYYSSFDSFCAFLQILDMELLLVGNKFVFLFEEEKRLYPIDFKRKFDIDYTEKKATPFRVEEITKLIYHFQLSSHNGGDYFNEIFHEHPNLLFYPSFMFDDYVEQIRILKTAVNNGREHGASDQVIADVICKYNNYSKDVVLSLLSIKHPSDKDYLVTIFLANKNITACLDCSSRIVPALFLQPHFSNLYYTMDVRENNTVTVCSEEYENIRSSGILHEFKYIKSFAPIRRITTSYAASIKFALNYINQKREEDPNCGIVIGDRMNRRLLNRGYMIDPDDRLFKDSVLVRFEDAKTEPKRIFHLLTDFLDIPYTESMTYCSTVLGKNTESYPGNAVGFDTSAVYRTYDDYANMEERKFLEYMFADAYEKYGYDYHYLKKEDMVSETIATLIDQFSCFEGYLLKSYEQRSYTAVKCDIDHVTEDNYKQLSREQCSEHIHMFRETSRKFFELMEGKPIFVNQKGQPLRYIPLLR